MSPHYKNRFRDLIRYRFENELPAEQYIELHRKTEWVEVAGVPGLVGWSLAEKHGKIECFVEHKPHPIERNRSEGEDTTKDKDKVEETFTIKTPEWWCRDIEVEGEYEVDAAATVEVEDAEHSISHPFIPSSTPGYKCNTQTGWCVPLDWKEGQGQWWMGSTDKNEDLEDDYDWETTPTTPTKTPKAGLADDDSDESEYDEDSLELMRLSDLALDPSYKHELPVARPWVLDPVSAHFATR
jgi:hypothetical protein